MFWAVARTEARREAVAQHFLTLAGFECYLPKVRAQRQVPGGRKIEVRLPLFPTYCFFRVEGAWHSARWSVAVVGLIMDGERPARLADAIVDEIKRRENRHGLIELPKPPIARPGDTVRITRGVLAGRLALFEGQRPGERIAVLLAALGRLTLRAGDVEAI